MDGTIDIDAIREKGEGSPDDREEITKTQLTDYSRENIAGVIRRLENEMVILQTCGRKIADEFFRDKKFAREDGLDYGKYGTRIRTEDDGFQAVWYRMTRSTEKVKQSKQMSKGSRSNYKYPDKAFREAPPHEKEIIDIAEEAYEPLRRRRHILQMLMASLKEYENYN